MADILQEKSYSFALRVVKLREFLHDKKHELFCQEGYWSQVPI